MVLVVGCVLIGSSLLIVRRPSSVPDTPQHDRVTFDTFESAVIDRARNSDSRKLVLLVAFVDAVYLRMAINLYQSSIKPNNMSTWTLFLCTTHSTCSDIQKHGLPSCLYSNTTDESLKIRAARDVLSIGYDVMVSDVDVTYFTSPIPYIRENCAENCDVAIQQKVDHTYNAGFYFVRASRKTVNFFGQIITYMETNHNDELNDVIVKLLNTTNEQNNSEQSVIIKTLPPKRFQEGSRHFKDVFTKGHSFLLTSSGKTILVHHSQVSRAIEKEYLMKEAGLWVLDGNGYYTNVHARYITYGNTIAESPFADKEELKALRVGLTVAYITKRVLILPRFHRDGVEVPAHVKLNVTKLYADFGDTIRESTFLENPKVRAVMTSSSRSTSRRCGKLYHIHAGVSADVPKKHRNKLTILRPENRIKGATLSEIAVWLERLSSCPVISFDSLYGVLDLTSATLDDPAFQGRLRTGIRKIKKH